LLCGFHQVGSVRGKCGVGAIAVKGLPGHSKGVGSTTMGVDNAIGYTIEPIAGIDCSTHMEALTSQGRG